jgi:putative phosphoribosyl transferase
MQVVPIFRDRSEAGKALSEQLRYFVRDQDPLILGLPRGGVPVACEAARTLQVELDVFLVRKLGLPSQEELAIGAIASGDVRVLNEALVSELQLSPGLIDQITLREKQELERREKLYRQGRTATPIRDRTVILIDDGLATGSSMKAASKALQAQAPKRIIVAVPVAAIQTVDELRLNVDQVVCAYTPEPFMAVGVWYEDFSQVDDDEVIRLLAQAEQETAVRRRQNRQS